MGGSSGFRLLGRLTADLILRSPQYLNPCKDYEIDLRGNKISFIENLSATENQFDSIDLSDNSIACLENFPILPRLHTIIMNNNRINKISENLENKVPNLEMLILTNNKIEALIDSEKLRGFSKLKYLSLIGNPISKLDNYRLYVISRCKHLIWLDFKRIKISERQEAEKVYGAECQSLKKLKKNLSN